MRVWIGAILIALAVAAFMLIVLIFNKPKHIQPPPPQTSPATLSA